MRFPALLLTFLLAAPLLPAAETAAAAPERYQMRSIHDSNGIGIFYMDREIARVMGHQAADWLERPQREDEEKTDQMVELLKFREGEVVADIGVGSGYVARKIAKKVGETGTVYGVDIQPEMLQVLEKRMAMFRITNVKPTLGEEADPKLPAASCDTMIMVDVYHELKFPYEMISAMLQALKPGGRLVFVEFRGEDPAVPIKEVHKMTEAQVKKEMAVFPLEFVENFKELPWQHLIVFKKTGDKSADASCCKTPTSRASMLTRGATK